MVKYLELKRVRTREVGVCNATLPSQTNIVPFLFEELFFIFLDFTVDTLQKYYKSKKGFIQQQQQQGFMLLHYRKKR